MNIVLVILGVIAFFTFALLKAAIANSCGSSHWAITIERFEIFRTVFSIKSLVSSKMKQVLI